MLKEMHAVLPAADLERARKFYHDMLGMDPVEEHPDEMLVTYRVDGAMFDVYQTENAGTAKNTQLCFGTDDLDEEMRMMRERGIVFEEFEIPGVMKTENGVVTNAESKTAWFRDSEGNFICLAQDLRAGMDSGSRMGEQMGGQMGSGSMGSGSMSGGSMSGGQMGGGQMGGGQMGGGMDSPMTGDEGGSMTTGTGRMS